MNGAEDRAQAPGWDEALSVWWLITWRTIALLILINVTLFMLLALFGGVGPGMDGARAMAGHPALMVLVWPIYIGVGVWVVRMALAKRYRNFRISLVRTDAPDSTGNPAP